MPNKNVETRYYNERTGKEEWRYKHYDKTYSCLGGTAALARYLIDPPPDGYSLPKGIQQITRVVKVEKILKIAYIMAEEELRK